MKENKFDLTTEQLKEIAASFKAKFEKGLKEENQEIQCIPTYIIPKSSITEGKALVLDLGGTNYRAAVVEFNKEGATIRPNDAWNKKLDIIKEAACTQEDLFREQADLISEIEHDQELPIGYCFSYPAESMLDGDAKLLRWTKGVNIKEMIGQPVGKPLMDYLNKKGIAEFTSIKVINDTVASLFAGLVKSEYDAYIGLIVGTGTNTAAFVPSTSIPKLNPDFKEEGLIPVNLESGNYYPPFLTDIDDVVDSKSDVPGAQRFEKAVSGMYLGEIFKAVFPAVEKQDFNAKDLNYIINNPDLYKDDVVNIANQIYRRSAYLVAASLAGVITTIAQYNPAIKNVCLTAEGSLFWSKVNDGSDYHEMVMDKLHELLAEFGLKEIRVGVEEKKNINLIGTAIAALS